MSTLVFRTETTGIPRTKKSPADPSQPRIMQISAILYDARRLEVGMMSTLIRPDGWIAAAGAAEAHGIEQRKCENYGVRLLGALGMFMDMVRSTKEVVAFGFAFHAFMIDIELAKQGSTIDAWTKSGLIRTCAQTRAANICNAGKSIKLEAAHLAMCETEFVQRHGVLEDLRAIARIHFATIDRSY